MEKEKYYIECVLIDNETEDFAKLCNFVEEFGKNGDMLSFKLKNYSTDNELLLQIIPKREIKKIISHCRSQDIKELCEE